jgi:hypothetical protein
MAYMWVLERKVAGGFVTVLYHAFVGLPVRYAGA